MINQLKMAVFFVFYILFFQLLSVSAELTRDMINKYTDHDPKTKVYFLRDSNYDDFVNYNDLVLVAFHEDE